MFQEHEVLIIQSMMSRNLENNKEAFKSLLELGSYRRSIVSYALRQNSDTFDQI